MKQKTNTCFVQKERAWLCAEHDGAEWRLTDAPQRAEKLQLCHWIPKGLLKFHALADENANDPWFICRFICHMMQLWLYLCDWVALTRVGMMSSSWWSLNESGSSRNWTNVPGVVDERRYGNKWLLSEPGSRVSYRWDWSSSLNLSDFYSLYFAALFYFIDLNKAAICVRRPDALFVQIYVSWLQWDFFITSRPPLCSYWITVSCVQCSAPRVRSQSSSHSASTGK